MSKVTEQRSPASVSTLRDVLSTKIVDWGVPLNHCIKLLRLNRYLRAQIEPRPWRYGAAGFALPALGLSDNDGIMVTNKNGPAS